MFGAAQCSIWQTADYQGASSASDTLDTSRRAQHPSSVCEHTQNQVLGRCLSTRIRGSEKPIACEVPRIR